MKLLKSFASSLVLLTSLGCQHITDLPDVCPDIQLPASGDGYSVCTISKKEERIPKEQFEFQRKQMICFDANEYAKIKLTFLKHCNTTPCKQVVGTFDDLFKFLDQAIDTIY